jgi:hypothetical protein
MNILPTNYTVAQLASAVEEKRLTINHNYQRSDAVWPAFARSLLVETVLLGYPMPKLIIRQRTDVKNLKTFEEIVDGQQRTMALVAYLKGEFALVSTLESEHLRGKTVHTLDEVDREKFVTYSIGADLLVGASDLEVIEVFRRMNSYTAPLNPEEQRHAAFQGEFKWFIYELRRICEPTLTSVGVFKQKALVRMQDGKLLTELCHAALHGITTTDRKKLDSLYSKFDKAFPMQGELGPSLGHAIKLAASYSAVEGSDLAKPYNFYALTLAALQLTAPRPELVGQLNGLEGGLADKQVVEANLHLLSDCLQQDESAEDLLFEEFYNAASATTNTKGNRAARYRWFYRALSNQMP